MDDTNDTRSAEHADTEKLRHIARACVDVHDSLERSGHFAAGCTERKFLIGASQLLQELADKFEAAAASSPKLAVWYGSMPESNGRENWTAILHSGDVTKGITIDRSEYRERVKYEAERMRWLIGDRPTEPDILAYDPDIHSGYVEPASAEKQDAAQ